MNTEPTVARISLSFLGRDGEVPEKSGLNWWNASGRPRNPDEVYIALPAAQLAEAEAVFGTALNQTTFLARMHDGTEMRMRLEGQQGSDRRLAKQITSDAHKSVLGEWILRRVLGVPYGEVVTRRHLEAYGRLEISFVRAGTDPTSGEAIVDGDFSPHSPERVRADSIRAVVDADLAAMAEEERALEYSTTAESLEGAGPDTEGTLKKKFTNHYERKPHLRAQAILFHGTTCQGCGFDFETLYGEWGQDYIEVHHLRPVSTLGGDLVDPETDMAVLCANCHRMVHRRKDRVLSLDELHLLLDGKHLTVR